MRSRGCQKRASVSVISLRPTRVHPHGGHKNCGGRHPRYLSGNHFFTKAFISASAAPANSKP